MTRALLLAAALAAFPFLGSADARPTYPGPTIDVAAVPAYPVVDRAKPGRPARAAGRRALDANGTAARAPAARKAPRRAPEGQTARGRFTTVSAAGGLTLTGEPGFVSKAASVVGELVAAGYTPKRVTCLSYSKRHVRGSFHFRGRACDVDQTGWGRTPAPKVVLRLIVARHGLRDGCEFRDAGHFDDGPRLPFARVLRNCGAAYAAVTMPKAFAAHVKVKVAVQ